MGWGAVNGDRGGVRDGLLIKRMGEVWDGELCGGGPGDFWDIVDGERCERGQGEVWYDAVKAVGGRGVGLGCCLRGWGMVQDGKTMNGERGRFGMADAVNGDGGGLGWGGSVKGEARSSE